MTMTITDDQRLKRLVRAKILLLLDQPFYGTLATRMVNHFDDTVQTVSTDSTGIFWNRTFLDELDDQILKTVLAHEVMHAANGHAWRRGERDPDAWNAACDRAINPILRDSGFELPKGAIMPPTADENRAAEHYYHPPTKGDGKGQGQGKGQGAGSGGGQGKGPGQGQSGEGDGKGNGKGAPSSDPSGCGTVQDAPGGEQKNRDQETEWKVALAEALNAAKSQGKLPAGLERLIDEIINPKVHWEVLLRDFVERTARNDYNWTRPNRRYLGRGIVLPSLISEELPAIVIAIDTSGSIGKEELNNFASEISGVLGAYETTIHIVYADAAVAKTEVVTRADLPLKLKAIGGGGTDFRPVFKWVEKQMIQPACLIYLTDGLGTFPPAAADYPVLWVMTTDEAAPTLLGETVKLQ